MAGVFAAAFVNTTLVTLLNSMPSTPPMTSAAAREALHELASPKRAAHFQRFFKSGPGEYAAGDVFIGNTVPQIRGVLKQFREMPADEIEPLIRSRIHEERLLGLLILVHQSRRGDATTRRRIYKQYIAAKAHINNWDLIDASAETIVGGYLRGIASARDPWPTLAKLARSPVWSDRRIAVLATFHFIRNHEFDLTLRLCELLLTDPHDLLHKATGWLLREIGKRHAATLVTFLDQHATVMPRTMLRYAIERLPEAQRRRYMQQRSALARTRGR